ncbi:MAG: GerMN domain-containing protein [Desulfosporosinus sp.]|jgi:germination protein M
MPKHISKTFFLLIIAGFICGILLTGCTSAKTTLQSGDPANISPENAQTPSDNQVTPPVTTQQSKKLTLYFPNADASGLITTNRTVTVKDQEIIKTMFIELATPPPGLEKPLPQGTTLLSATVSADGVATINLSRDFQKNFGGGSAGELMTMYSIVNSLTTLPNIHSVQFLLEGKKHNGILGHLDTSVPLKRNDSLILK